MRPIRICVLGLVLLVVGLGIFFGAQLKYLPKYHTIVVVNYYTGCVRETGEWLILGGVSALGALGGILLSRMIRRAQRREPILSGLLK